MSTEHTEQQALLEKKRHTLAHLLAAAVLKIYPDALPTIGPAVEDGFYYDFAFSEPVSADDLKAIEKQMKKAINSWDAMTGEVVSAERAREVFAGNKYKLELIDEIVTAGEDITLYTAGDFTDLCRGGHAENPKSELDMKAFTLAKVAGAYWRGDEDNDQLTRIYGYAFDTKEELDAYKKQLEEAKKRDHRKLGKELDLFTFSDLVGSGLPLWTPRGTLLRTALQNKLLSISEKYGMQPVTIPHIAKRALYDTSGHSTKFGDELIKVTSHYDEFVMKPVNCPHHTQIYASVPRSYRDLPLRYMESTMQYRDEKPGELSGLTRVRSITVDDGHIFCRGDQVKQEASNIAKIIEEFYTSLGLYGNHWVSLSVRDPEKPENYVGGEEGWQNAETVLQELSDDLGLDAKRMEGEAAIYGPKLDFMFKDALGREWQLATIQIDFALPERFGLTFTNVDGDDETPVMIHRAILGSYERFLAILIEHFAGAFPLWLAPVQVVVAPVSDKFADYAETVAAALREQPMRVEIDTTSETLGKRIRVAEKAKVPYMLVVGEKEIAEKTVAVRSHADGDLGSLSLDAFLTRIHDEL